MTLVPVLPPSNPTLDDWISAKPLRKVHMEQAGPFRSANPNNFRIMCTLSVYAPGVYLSFEGFADTTGDAFVAALKVAVKTMAGKEESR